MGRSLQVLMCPHDCLQDPANIEVSSPCARIMMVCVLRSKAEAWLRILLEDALRADVLAAKQRRSVAFDRSHDVTDPRREDFQAILSSLEPRQTNSEILFLNNNEKVVPEMATQMSHPHDSPLSSIEEIDIKDRPQAHKLEYRRSSKTDRLIEILAMSAKGKKKSGAPQGRRESTRVSISSGECSELAAPRDEVRRNYLATFPSDIINKRKYLAGRNAILEENNKKLRDLAVRFLPKRYFFYFNSIIQIQLHRYNKMLVTINTEQKYALVERVSSFHVSVRLMVFAVLMLHQGCFHTFDIFSCLAQPSSKTRKEKEVENYASFFVCNLDIPSP
mmetsp:Transcript_24319/g.61392  ORF Transcript_24319/g.61392 Transcript_24319/m.61392 type:complete len:333 (-) Transcript_24319:1762-2760(-)